MRGQLLKSSGTEDDASFLSTEVCVHARDTPTREKMCEAYWHDDLYKSMLTAAFSENRYAACEMVQP
jgi:hypothetical protein